MASRSIPIPGVFGSKSSKSVPATVVPLLSGNTDSPVPRESSPFLPAWAWRHPPHDSLITAGPPGPRTLWSVPVHMSLRYLSRISYIRQQLIMAPGVPESIIPAVSQRSTGAGEVPDSSGRMVRTPDDRPGDPAIVFRTPGIIQVIPEHPSPDFRLISSSDFSSLLTSLLFGLQ